MQRLDSNQSEFQISTFEIDDLFKALENYIDSGNTFHYFNSDEIKEICQRKNIFRLFELMHIDLYDNELEYILNCQIEPIRTQSDFEIFQVIASYIYSDSYLQYTDEEGDKYRYLFKNGIVKIIKPKLIWDEDYTNSLDSVISTLKRTIKE